MADFLTDFSADSGPGSCIVSEANGYRSRDQVLVAASTVVTAGDILGKVTASGYYVPLAPGASDGSQTAACIALDSVASSTSTTRIPVFARDGEFNADQVGPSALTTLQKQTAFGQLRSAGLIPSATIANPTIARPTP